MRAVETGSSVGSSYALAYAVSSCVTEPSWRPGVRHGAGQPASASPAHAKVPRGASEQHSGRSAIGCPHTWMGAGPALGAHRHSGTDPRNSQRARRVALACEVVSEDHITRSKTARGSIADPDFHLPHENKNVLSPGRGVPIAPIVRRETAEHEVGTRLKRNVVALLGRQDPSLYCHDCAPSSGDGLATAQIMGGEHSGRIRRSAIIVDEGQRSVDVRT